MAGLSFAVLVLIAGGADALQASCVMRPIARPLRAPQCVAMSVPFEETGNEGSTAFGTDDGATDVSLAASDIEAILAEEKKQAKELDAKEKWLVKIDEATAANAAALAKQAKKEAMQATAEAESAKKAMADALAAAEAEAMFKAQQELAGIKDELSVIAKDVEEAAASAQEEVEEDAAEADEEVAAVAPAAVASPVEEVPLKLPEFDMPELDLKGLASGVEGVAGEVGKTIGHGMSVGLDRAGTWAKAEAEALPGKVSTWAKAEVEALRQEAQAAVEEKVEEVKATPTKLQQLAVNKVEEVKDRVVSAPMRLKAATLATYAEAQAEAKALPALVEARVREAPVALQAKVEAHAALLASKVDGLRQRVREEVLGAPSKAKLLAASTVDETRALTLAKVEQTKAGVEGAPLVLRRKASSGLERLKAEVQLVPTKVQIKVSKKMLGEVSGARSKLVDARKRRAQLRREVAEGNERLKVRLLTGKAPPPKRTPKNKIEALEMAISDRYKAISLKLAGALKQEEEKKK